MRKRYSMNFFKKQFSDALINLSLCPDGGLDENRVLYIIDALAENIKEKDLVIVLNRYFSAIKKYCDEHILKIYHCGDISFDQISNIRSNFELRFGKSFEVSVEEDQNVIAGIRVQIDDLVFENSIALALNNYKVSLNKRAH